MTLGEPLKKLIIRFIYTYIYIYVFFNMKNQYTLGNFLFFALVNHLPNQRRGVLAEIASKGLQVYVVCLAQGEAFVNL